jgi:hypothetical protein
MFVFYAKRNNLTKDKVPVRNHLKPGRCRRYRLRKHTTTHEYRVCASDVGRIYNRLPSAHEVILVGERCPQGEALQSTDGLGFLHGWRADETDGRRRSEKQRAARQRNSQTRWRLTALVVSNRSWPVISGKQVGLAGGKRYVKVECLHARKSVGKRAVFG